MRSAVFRFDEEWDFLDAPLPPVRSRRQSSPGHAAPPLRGVTLSGHGPTADTTLGDPTLCRPGRSGCLVCGDEQCQHFCLVGHRISVLNMPSTAQGGVSYRPGEKVFPVDTLPLRNCCQMAIDTRST